MIRDARVLRAGFVPQEVEHRDAEVNHLSSVLEPITNGEPADTAIGMLRSAASTADRENRQEITDDILLNAAGDARTQIKQKSLDSLTPHQRVVYDIVRKHDPLGPSEIYDRCTAEVDDPRTKRTVRTYLSKMAQYNLLEAEGTSRDREYSAVDSAATSPVS